MPRATACSSSTIRIVAATRRCYTESCHRPAGTLARPWYPTARSSGRLVAARPGRRAAARSDSDRPTSGGPLPCPPLPPADARRRAPRDHRQEGRPPAPRWPPARRRLRPRRRVGRTSPSTPTSSSSSAAQSAPNTLVDLSVDGGKAQPGPRPRRPGPPGQPPAAPRRPVRRAHDRGADRRRAARGRSASPPAVDDAGRDAPPPDRDGPRPGPAGPPARSRSSTRSSRSSTSTTTIHVRDLDDPRRRDAADRPRRGRRQGPAAARSRSRRCRSPPRSPRARRAPRAPRKARRGRRQSGAGDEVRAGLGRHESDEG